MPFALDTEQQLALGEVQGGLKEQRTQMSRERVRADRRGPKEKVRLLIHLPGSSYNLCPPCQ